MATVYVARGHNGERDAIADEPHTHAARVISVEPCNVSTDRTLLSSGATAHLASADCLAAAVRVNDRERRSWLGAGFRLWPRPQGRPVHQLGLTNHARRQQLRPVIAPSW